MTGAYHQSLGINQATPLTRFESWRAHHLQKILIVVAPGPRDPYVPWCNTWRGAWSGHSGDRSDSGWNDFVEYSGWLNAHFRPPRWFQILSDQAICHLPGKDKYPVVADRSLSHPRVHPAFFRLPREPAPVTEVLRKDHRYQ